MGCSVCRGRLTSQGNPGAASVLKAIAAALQFSVTELYALAEGRTFATGSTSSEVHPDDLARDAVQMRRYFRSLSPEYQKLALEIVKTLVRTQAKS